MPKRAIKLKHYFLQDINPVVRFLILSDTVMSGAVGLLGPIFALFIADFIQGGNEAVAGLAAGIYMFTRGVLQIPFAHIMDRIRGEKDDYWFMVTFTMIIAVVPLAYLMIGTPLQLYIVQAVLGLCTAFTYPSFMAIFTRHIDKKKEGTEWGIYFTLNDFVSALFAALGGYVAATQGFYVLILSVVAINVMGTSILWFIRPYIRGIHTRKVSS